MMTSQPAPALTAAKEWDQLRAAFAASLMVDLALTSLAQNLDGVDWPLRGADEKPSTYIDFTYGELVAEFSDRGHPEAAALLIQILRETIAFDQPFGEMVKQTEAASGRDNELLRTLGRLGIPENFPLELTALDLDARELCRLEKVDTLGEFAVFAQNLSQNVIVGGDLKRLLNALAHVDGAALAGIVPFRPGSTGLHLAEALVLAARQPQPAEQIAATLAWFAAEFADWRTQAATDRHFLSRRFAALADSEMEARLLPLLTPHFHPVPAESGRWSKLLRWFKRSA